MSPPAPPPTSTSGHRVAAALSYRDGMAAPVVVARGRGLVADEIVRRAREHGVAIQVSGQLASLLAQVELDHPIPPQLFAAVAELLAWLYHLEGRTAPRPGHAAVASAARTVASHPLIG